jgi:hypothetical protein
MMLTMDVRAWYDAIGPRSLANRKTSLVTQLPRIENLTALTSDALADSGMNRFYGGPIRPLGKAYRAGDS